MKIRNIFGLALAAALVFGSCTDEKDMTKVDQWLGGKFNQEILWDVDSLAFRRTSWETQDIADGLEMRKSSIKMWGSVQSISYVTFSPVLFNTALGYTGSEGTVGEIAGNYDDVLFAINAGSFAGGKAADFLKVEGEVKNESVSERAEGLFGINVKVVSENLSLTDVKLISDVTDHAGFSSAIATGAMLVRNGEAMTTFPEGEFYDARMARTFIGLTAAGNCVFGIIDGGVTGHADGATVKEAAVIAQLMGLKSAALLGCGDETTIWSKKDGVLNAPSAGSAGKVGSVIYVGKGSVTVNGDGSKSNPYIIGNHVHMMLMRSLCPAGSTTYLSLENDIDMSSVKVWTPLNYDSGFTRQIHFEGNGKTISNFAPESFVGDDQTTPASYPSLFGVLYGSCKNVTIKDAKIIKDAETAAIGILGGYLGTVQNNISMPANIENVHVINAEIVGKSDLGLFGGQSRDATCINCTATGKIVIGNMANSGGNGGFIGRAAGKTVFENCTSDVHYSASVNLGKSFRLGGILGYAATIGGSDLTRDKLVIKRCSAAGTLFNDKYSSQAVGGLVGYMGMPNAEITESFSTINIEGGRTDVSGAGGNTQCVGGLIGICSTATKCTIANCYSTSSKDFIVGQKSGGIVGQLEKGLLVIQNSYSNYVINGYSGLGGIIGVATAAPTVEVEGCIAWNPSITAFRDAGDKYSSGALAGCILGKCSFTKSYRHPSMQFTDPFRTMKNHDDIVNGTPANDNADNPAGTANQNAFDGQPSVETTLTATALKAGWSETFWDFSGDEPKLVWTLSK